MWYSWVTRKMFALDCNANKGEKWEWKQCHKELRHKRTDTSACMVDRDKYIAILGGITNGYASANGAAELFAVNCGVSIDLAKMNKNKMNGSCEYNDKYHGIIACGRDIVEGIELYDIN